MTDFYDDLETRSPEQREQALLGSLPGHIAHAKWKAPYFGKLLKQVDPEAVRDRSALASIPVTRKSDLIALQKESPPFGGMTSVAHGDLGRIFSSPGPIYDPQGATGDFWRFGRALWAAGLRRGDVLHNCFSYHFTPAGFMVDLGAQAVGCAVFPAGVGQTEMQVQTIADLRPNAYGGTPSFLKIILEKADEMGVDVSCLGKALVSGEALLPAVRESFLKRGIEVRQCYGTADLGLIAYESSPDAGLVVDEGVLLEIVRPGSNDPVSEGEVGEVVVTNLSTEYPLIRFGTGDLSALLPGQSPCGRTNMRIKGWMGRADQTAKVKGMFVHPSQVAEIAKRYPQVIRARLVIEHDVQSNDRMTLQCEVANDGDSLASAISDTIREITKLRGEVSVVPPGSLANDGKVIDDLRKFN
ncbi:MAG TPA: AMP-binding protein [Burkholderiales bacterium]|nr:AMP-binding protein [Burkholderiales bacterium]